MFEHMRGASSWYGNYEQDDDIVTLLQRDKQTSTVKGERVQVKHLN